jgi:GT2 family glycosyltransferase
MSCQQDRPGDLQLTIASVPKPFTGTTAVQQRNAIQSWSKLPCRANLILMGGEKGVGDIAREVGARCIDEIDRNEFGTPLLSSIYHRLHENQQSSILCFVNADIILLPNIVNGIVEAQKRFDQFLMIARRRNIELNEPIRFEDGWDESLRNRVLKEGELFTHFGIDIFVFTSNLFKRVPPFAIGRSYWDNWLVSEARRLQAPVIDATKDWCVVHQNHEYTNFSSMDDIRRSPQGKRNFYLSGDSLIRVAGTFDATHLLAGNEITPAETKTVTVIIPHVGSRDSVRSCLQALTYQTYPRTFIEAIVVANDEMTDLTGFESEFPFVRTCRELRKGPAAARNKGAACATGEVLAFLDSDCRPTAGWLAAGVKALPGDGQKVLIAGNITRSYGRSGQRNYVQAFDSVTYLQQERYVTACAACVAANVFVKRSDFWSIGPFDESYGEASGEDWEWSTRATGNGYSIRFLADASVVHPALANQRTLRRKVERIGRGNALSYLKAVNDPGCRTNPDHVKLPGFKELLKRLRRLWREPRLSRFERTFALLLQVRAWVWERRAWRSSAAVKEARK